MTGSGRRWLLTSHLPNLPVSWGSLTLRQHFSLYQHYSTSDRACYLSLDEAPAFTRLYEEVDRLKSSRAADLQTAVLMVEDVFRQFERYLRDGTLNEKLLLKCRARHGRRR